MTETSQRLVDRFGRRVDYVRLSVTDRCDFRCVYCMAEEMEFLPKAQILTLEELYSVAQAFVSLGVKKIRLTGGEPLIRRGIMGLVEKLGRMEGLENLVITTNGSQLDTLAPDLVRYGVRSLNISLDSLKPDRFKVLTRTGHLEKVIRGIDAAVDAGFQKVKINAVILRGRNDDEVLDLVDFARERKTDISFIEEMPLGTISEHSREEAFISSSELREVIGKKYSLVPDLGGNKDVPSGPSVYYRMENTSTRIGFISPHSHNFCNLCNRVRVTVEGRLLLCLGNEHSTDLKSTLRRYPGDLEALQSHLIQAMDLKPERHYFELNDEVQLVRFMNMTGG